MLDCFEVLGLPDTATLDQVKSAYRRLAELHHPDKGGSAVVFADIVLAYKKASELSQEPITCPECEGTGMIEHRRGWSAAQVVCAKCGGKGMVKR